ncbi:hypothetical protein [Prochlorococcus sp. MIT 1223]|uniref:hypothetical protein n=1 Tax=Prochlorococcus sp. MIT 1223 TaxID=3096217 RepID=UPI002A7605C0|nr:hypothetical protein [Prochlorococcus sp. MIT 1223]
MGQYRESSSSSLGSLLSGAILGAAGLAWWLFAEAERRQESRKQRAMLYAPRIQDGSEAIDSSNSVIEKKTSENLEHRVEQLNSAIADVRKQLEDLGEKV